jgi:hypothetical protein
MNGRAIHIGECSKPEWHLRTNPARRHMSGWPAHQDIVIIIVRKDRHIRSDILDALPDRRKGCER